MAKQAETNFKERIRPRLEAITRSWWLKTQLWTLLGIPDFIGCINGHFVALELKKDEYTEASKLQAWVLRKIIEAGGVGVVIDPQNFEDVYQILSDMGKGKLTFKPTASPDLRKLDS